MGMDMLCSSSACCAGLQLRTSAVRYDGLGEGTHDAEFATIGRLNCTDVGGVYQPKATRVVRIARHKGVVLQKSVGPASGSRGVSNVGLFAICDDQTLSESDEPTYDSGCLMKVQGGSGFCVSKRQGLC